MKEEKKNIDRLFQEKFRDFEAAPSDEVWRNIKQELTKEENSRIILLPFWYRIGGVAAALLVLFMIGNFWFSTQQNSSIVNQDQIQPLEQTQSTVAKSHSDTADEKIDKTEPKFQEEENISDLINNKTSNQNLVSSENEKVSSMNARKTEDNQQLTQIEQPLRGHDIGEPLAEIQTSERVRDDGEIEAVNQEIGSIDILNHSENSSDPSSYFSEEIIIDGDNPAEITNIETPELNESSGKSIFDEISELEEMEEDNQDSKTLINRFAIRPNVAPVYYNSMKGGSAVDPTLAGNKSEGEVTMSYGVDVSYAVSSRIKVRTGINKVNMSYNTPDIAFISSPGSQGLKNVENNPQAKDILVIKSDAVRINPDEISNNSAAPYTFGKLNQQLEYIEVPIEVEFALLDKRFGVNVIGGASTLFLKDDAVRINSDLGSTDLGRASNLNSVSFTTNIGIGFDYNLTETFNFNIEPTFKYQVNGFSGDSGGFKPYYFGVYSGISVRF